MLYPQNYPYHSSNYEITKDVALRVSVEIFRRSLGIQISSMGHTGEITLDRLLYPDY